MATATNMTAFHSLGLVAVRTPEADPSPESAPGSRAQGKDLRTWTEAHTSLKSSIRASWISGTFSESESLHFSLARSLAFSMPLALCVCRLSHRKLLPASSVEAESETILDPVLDSSRANSLAARCCTLRCMLANAFGPFEVSERPLTLI